MEFPENVPWYNLVHLSKDLSIDNPREVVSKLYEKGRRAYDRYLKAHPLDEITAQLVDAGTLTDRFAAVKTIASKQSLIVLPHLDTLLGYLDKKPRLAMEAGRYMVDTLKKLLPDRPLRKFGEQDLQKTSESHLFFYYFEDRMKSVAANTVIKLEIMSKSSQQFARDFAIKAIGNLLMNTVENEHLLLSILVDKFGDPNRSIASVASGVLKQVLKKYPMMNSAVSQLVDQKRFDDKTKQRVLKFLGQLQVNTTEVSDNIVHQILDELPDALKSNPKVAKDLMRAAEKCVKMSAPGSLDPLIEPLYEYTEHTHSVPAFRLLLAIHKRSSSMMDRFYRQLFTSSDLTKNSIYPILYEGLKDASDVICANFLQKVLVTGVNQSLPVAAAALIFAIRFLWMHPKVRSLFKSNDREQELKFSFEMKDPMNVGALASFPWIMSLYSIHYHPTIQQLASFLVAGQNLDYEGDPSTDFALPALVKRLCNSNQELDPIITESFRDFDEIMEEQTDSDASDNQEE